jgi:hypothetical protein
MICDICNKEVKDSNTINTSSYWGSDKYPNVYITGHKLCLSNVDRKIVTPNRHIFDNYVEDNIKKT